MSECVQHELWGDVTLELNDFDKNFKFNSMLVTPLAHANCTRGHSPQGEIFLSFPIKEMGYIKKVS